MNNAIINLKNSIKQQIGSMRAFINQYSPSVFNILYNIYNPYTDSVRYMHITLLKIKVPTKKKDLEKRSKYVNRHNYTYNTHIHLLSIFDNYNTSG